eukprot:CAMPEP_0115253100 /NCGR_PEP_ID=MMETSP0270-20121206/44494_1 /TAXON_ID=71861 /ORGANISM="Scrippsiella trochoidea, Strain CCMP3099" /LENGTH=53 /DNA_ID=CAMNT_0002668587 /DNA_START=456 /DNA_END=617 /DNA_ORIENTATION=+
MPPKPSPDSVDELILLNYLQIPHDLTCYLWFILAILVQWKELRLNVILDPSEE